MRVVGDIIRLNAKRFPNKIGFRFGRQSLTFAAANDLANRVSNGLRQHGVKPTDRVALLALNRLDYLPIVFATAKCGAMSVPLNFRCTVDELTYMLIDAQVETLIVGPGFEASGKMLIDRVPSLKRLIAIECSADSVGMNCMDELIASGAPDEPAIDICEESGVVILYTSGTTGHPKGAVLSHRSVVDGACQTALATRIRHADTALVTVPLFHGGGLAVVSMSHLYLGAGLVIHEKFDPDETLRSLADDSVTTFFGVPAQLIAMLGNPGFNEAKLGNLRSLWYGAAPMPPVVLKALQDLLPNLDFVQTYGQTETTLTTCLGPEEHRTKPGATGRELPGIEIRIVNDDGQDVPAGGVGEILVRRLTGMIEYYGNPQQTAATIKDGWIYTGDLARIDQDRFITIVDRKRDVIMSGGENVYPKEIEDLVIQHEAVAQIAVIGVPNDRWGEVTKAFVVLKPSSCATATDLDAWCLNRLARYKRPREWEFVTALPMTATGKVRKNVLRQMAKTAAEGGR